MTPGWSVRPESVQTGHGYTDVLPCLVYEPVHGGVRLVAYISYGHLRHADAYEPFTAIPLDALDALRAAQP